MAEAATNMFIGQSELRIELKEMQQKGKQENTD